MILRYTNILEYLHLLQVNVIEQLLLFPRENRDVDNLLYHLKDIESVTKSLQKDDITLFNVRDLFDAISDTYPSCAEKLAPDAQIVEDNRFESGIVKAQQGKIDSLL
jgi:hypothetical protein